MARAALEVRMCKMRRDDEFNIHCNNASASFRLIYDTPEDMPIYATSKVIDVEITALYGADTVGLDEFVANVKNASMTAKQAYAMFSLIR